MAATRSFISSLFILGFLAAHCVIVSAQQDTLTNSSDGVMLIDTSDYLPYIYETSIDYNLMIAASKGYVSEIERLISNGADVNAESDAGVTPLIFAVINNRAEAVIALLKYNPLLDKVTSSYETPLIIAVKNDNPEIAELLIRAGADIDLPDQNGATALHYAAINGFLDVTDLLLYYNASIDQKSDDDITPLLAAIMAGYADVTDLLVQNGADLEARNKKGNTPFLMAAVTGDTLIMDLLYKHGVNIYATNNAHYSALDMSISTKQTGAVKYLLRIGDKWTTSSKSAVDPYLVAVKYRRKEMISLLKDNKVPGGVKYGIDQMAFSVSSRFTLKDYYAGFTLSFKEPYLNAGIITGLDMKLWYTRVLRKQSENLYYQYFDKGYLAYAGIFKDFMLSENPFKSNFVLTTTLLAGYSFGNTLKGTSMAPANNFMVIPDITIKWNVRKFSLFTGLEYIKSQFYHVGPVWLRAGFSYTLYFDRVRTQITPIKWY